MRTKNHFELRGFVGNDPEMKTLENKKEIVNLRIATNEVFNDKKGGEPKKVTDWHSVTLWNGKAKFAQQYIKKGALVSVEGRIKPRSYEKDGVTIFTIDLVVDTLDLILNKEE